MKILFLTYHGFDPASGISKKMLAQIKGLRQNGHEVHVCSYDYAGNGHLCRFVDDAVLHDYGTGKWAAICHRIHYGAIYHYCVEHHIDLVYVRHYMNASPWLVSFFRKLKKAGVKSLMEIPTYPYDHELDGFSFNQRMRLHIDQLYRGRLARQMEAVVTFSDYDTIFGQRTIRISNGVDFDSIPLHRPTHMPGELHLIGVAEVHVWHGFDRLIHGLGEYYFREQNPLKVVFHIVGDVYHDEMNGTRLAPGFRPLIERYGLADKVVFHNKLFGEPLNAVFDQCQFAIGSLARHRSGITHIKTLKNREYASRGIPFIYSECDADFDSAPYVLKAPADESPIDIQRIIDFMNSFTMQPADIRSTIQHLSWMHQMNQVLTLM